MFCQSQKKSLHFPALITPATPPKFRLKSASRNGNHNIRSAFASLSQKSDRRRAWPLADSISEQRTRADVVSDHSGQSINRIRSTSCHRERPPSFFFVDISLRAFAIPFDRRNGRQIKEQRHDKSIKSIRPYNKKERQAPKKPSNESSTQQQSENE